MQIVDAITKSVRLYEPKLTDWILERQPGRSRPSVQVGSIVGLTIGAIAILNDSGVGHEAIEVVVDLIVDNLPSMAPDSSQIVVLSDILGDKQTLEIAQQQLFGANGTDLKTATVVVYNALMPQVDQILSRSGSPAGFSGAIAAVLSEQFIGKDSSDGFLELLVLINEFILAVGSHHEQGELAGKQGCALSALLLLVFAGALLGGLGVGAAARVFGVA